MRLADYTPTELGYLRDFDATPVAEQRKVLTNRKLDRLRALRLIEAKRELATQKGRPHNFYVLTSLGVELLKQMQQVANESP